MMQPQIILVREGTDTSQGKAQLISNINACGAVCDIVRTTMGPRGMDKLIHTDRDVVISNDGATIMKTLDITHPAAACLVDIAKSQDSEVGDGTTSVVVLACEFLKECKPFIDEGVHPQVIIRAYRKASTMAVEKLNEWAISIKGKNDEEKRELLCRCASTALNSKLICHQRGIFAPMVVDAVMHLDSDMNLDMIGVKKVPGGSCEDSFLVHGVAFKKTFSYAGFEQQPKHFTDCKIVMLNVELELKSEKENAEIRIENPEDYQSIVDAEWNIIYDKLEKLASCGAQVILSKLAIGDLATQYFADRGMFCAGRVVSADLQRVAKACGGSVQTSVNNITPDVLGTCAVFEEKQVGAERFNIFSGCPQTKTATIVLRGGADQFIEEAERSIHDAICIVRRAVQHSSIVPGAGAIELELSRHLREYSRTIAGKQQLLINAFAKALEVIPRQISDNAGFDSTDIMNRLRQKHATGTGRWFGVDIESGSICDAYEAFVWEPLSVKLNAIAAATEAACMVLSIDETITAEQKDGGGGGGGGMMRGGPPRGAPRRGRGRGRG